MPTISSTFKYLLMNATKDLLFLETFVRHFIQKHRRERSLIELTDCRKRHQFINRLNHQWKNMLEMKYLQQLIPETENKEYVLSELGSDKNLFCYVFSNYNDCDDQWLPTPMAIERVWNRGLASLLITEDAKRIYLETEIESGRSQNRFIGNRIKI